MIMILAPSDSPSVGRASQAIRVRVPSLHTGGIPMGYYRPKIEIYKLNGMP